MYRKWMHDSDWFILFYLIVVAGTHLTQNLFRSGAMFTVIIVFLESDKAQDRQIDNR